jgi:hypothetical protein
MATATFRFYEELNDFLAPERRGREFACRCARATTARHAIESLGVPHTEVELILVNGESVGFDRALRDGDRVAVYPKFETLDVTPLVRVRDGTLRVTRFVAEVHLGRLARLLRLLGFDTWYDSRASAQQVGQLARAQQRIVLTRDRQLLTRSGLTHGCTVHAFQPEQQLREVFDRLDLARAARPFTRCLDCNGVLGAIGKQCLEGLVPTGVLERQPRFSICDGCARVYWEGTHWRRMRDLVDPLLAAAAC